MIYVLEAGARRVTCKGLSVSCGSSSHWPPTSSVCSFSQERPVLLLSFLFCVYLGVNNYSWNILVGGFKHVPEFLFCCRRNLERR